MPISTASLLQPAYVTGDSSSPCASADATTAAHSAGVRRFATTKMSGDLGGGAGDERVGAVAGSIYQRAATDEYSLLIPGYPRSMLMWSSSSETRAVAGRRKRRCGAGEGSAKPAAPPGTAASSRASICGLCARDCEEVVRRIAE